MRTPWSNGHRDAKSTTGTGSESARLRAEIDATHQRLEGLLGELNRRRREAFDVRLQMRRHPVAFAVAAALALGAMGGGTTLAVMRMRHRRRLQHSPSARLARLWQISGRRNANAGSGSGMLGSVATRAAQVAIAMLVRRLVSRAFAGRRARD
jgi:hypothetical protein